MENTSINETPEKKPVNRSNIYVVAINMLILVLYTVYIKTADHDSESIIALAFLIAYHVILNIIVGVILLMFRKVANYGKACLLSSAVVLLIGFSTCFIVST